MMKRAYGRIGAAGIGLAVLLAAGATMRSQAQPAADTPTAAARRTHELLHATLWAQQSAEYRALCLQAYNQAGVSLKTALKDKGWTAAIEQQGAEFGELPPAVILDVDETVLDNSFFEARMIRDGTFYGPETWDPWCEEEAATAVPGALEFCLEAHRLGATVFYVTNRKDHLREFTRNNLKRLGFPLREDLETVVTRSAESDKGSRRAAIAKTHRILLLIGDNAGDLGTEFNTAPTNAERKELADKYRDWFGTRWIALPNPMYGNWEALAIDNQWGAADEDRLAMKYAALRFDADPAELEPHPLSDESGAGRFPAREPVTRTQDVPRHPLLGAGPMPAWSEMTEAAIWVQTNAPADVQIRYWPEVSAEEARLSRVIRTEAEGDHIALFTVADLEPGALYGYELYLDGVQARFPWKLTFRTQTLWKWRAEPPAMTFTFGSCAYVNEPRFDRPGKPYGSEYEIFDAVAAEHPDFMLWLGDNTYLREADWGSASGIRHRNRHTRELPELQRLLASTHHYAIWDDHDFGPNDSDRSYPLKDAALEVFSDYWPATTRGLPGVRGCFQSFVRGDCEFFLLDDRYHRAPNNAPEDEAKTMLGEEQLQWLKDSLLASTATFKFIACGGQMINPSSPFESFNRYPHEQRDLMDFLVANRVEGVVFLSGDRHHSELLRVEREGGYPLFEFTSSALTAGAGGNPAEADNPSRVEGTWVTFRHSYGRVQVTGTTGSRKLVLSAHDKDGQEIWSYEIGEEDLRFAK